MAQLKGFGYPDFQLTPHGYLPIEEDITVIKANLKNLLETYKSERVMLQDYGAGLDRHVFAQKTGVLYARIRESVLDAIEVWEPSIVVEDITVGPPTEDDLPEETEFNHVVMIRILFSPKYDLSVEEVLTVLLPAA